MPASSVPELQNKLFKNLGIGTEPPVQKGGRGGRGRQPASRKEQRKASRVEKKTNRYSRSTAEPARTPKSRAVSTSSRLANGQPPGKSILKQRAPAKPELDSDSEGSQDFDDLDELAGGSGSGGESDYESDGISLDDTDVAPKEGKGLSRLMKDKLAEDDAEIEEYERRLGIKKGRKSLPQSFKEDGLDLLLDELSGDEGDGSEEDEGKKRKRDYDDWLSAKRRKTVSGTPKQKTKFEDDEEDMGIESDFSGSDDDSEGGLGSDEDDLDIHEYDDEDGSSFGGFESDSGETSSKPTKQKENPYVAPTTGNVVAKYVPPSLRKSNGSEDETRTRLRKQVQGLINRLTDANILSIVQATEELYQRNARGDVTEMLTDAILAQVCKPEALPDQFFVLTGGFSAAIYKIIGSSFGSHLVRRVVKDFGQEYDAAEKVQNEESAIPKEPSNLITFLSQLYVFEVVRCRIIFDYMERLLQDLTEINVELLLRICRNGGRLLRRDDPQALKSVSGALNRAVSKQGYATVSARTKFMVETIDDLKNKKGKGKGLDSAVVSEQVVRMKKHLGDLKSQSRRLDGLTPMGMDLDDVQSADSRGKWWLVGASVPAKSGEQLKEKKANKAKDKAKGEGKPSDPADDSSGVSDVESEDMDFVLPDYPNKARAQGLASPSQIAIFTALMTALDGDTGYRQFINLKMRKDEQLEIAKVLVQCVGSEAEYNPYYAAVGERACANSRIRFAFQARLWQIFRAMGESLFGEEEDDMDTADGVRFRDEQRVRKVGRFYASLIAGGALRLSVLKPLSLPELQPLAFVFVESLLLSLLEECKSKKPERENIKVEKAFGTAQDIPRLATGIDWFLREKIPRTKLLSSKKLNKLNEVKGKALLAVKEVEDS